MNLFDSPNFDKTRNYLLGTLTGLLIFNIVSDYIGDFLKPASAYLFNFTLQLLATLFSTYVEGIHKEIGEARSDGLTNTLYFVLFIAYGYTLLERVPDLFNKARKDKRRVESLNKELDDSRARIKRLSESEDLPQLIEGKPVKLSVILKEKEEALIKSIANREIRAVKARNFAYQVTVVFTIGSLGIAGVLIGNAYTRNASTFVERSIEILAPTIPQDKVLDLRSKYRSVDNAQKFYQLHDELRALAEDKGVKLPRFNPIKR
jgi:hypothetical protein